MRRNRWAGRPFSEFETMINDSTFVSTHPKEVPVEIRDNGTLIGYDRLVDVETKCGVHMLEYVGQCERF
jgi:flagellar motor switch/type III secretory pathway protein FliN